MLKTCRKRKQFIHLQKIKHKWKKIAIYKPTQLQAEVILQMAEGKGLKVYESTKYSFSTQKRRLAYVEEYRRKNNKTNRF